MKIQMNDIPINHIQQSEETAATLVDDLETGKSERQEESSHKTY